MAKITEINHQIHLLFQQYGIKSLTMDDLAQKLGCSKKTLYIYYTNRADLVYKVISQDLESHLSNIQSIFDLKKHPIDEFFLLNELDLKKLKTVHPSTLYDLHKYYPKTWKKFDEVTKQKGYEFILSNLKRGIELGVYRPEINTDIMARIITEKFEIIFNQSLFKSESTAFTTVYKELMTHYIYGIVNENGKKYFSKNIEKFTIDEII